MNSEYNVFSREDKSSAATAEPGMDEHSVGVVADFNLPQFLRGAGALAVGISGLVYMLQGLNGVDDALRYWAYLVLMVVLAVGGVFSQSFMKDAKGARLFFALSCLLVPVQFSQLSAMLHDMLVSHAGDIGTLPLAVVGGVSAVVGGFSAYFGLCILARPYAGYLTVVFLMLNALLLIPLRGFIPVSLLCVFILVAYVFVDRTIFMRDRRFFLLDGVTVKSMLLLPGVVVMSRYGFSVGDFFGVCLLASVLAAGAAFVSVKYVTNASIKVLSLATCFTAICLGWLGMAVELTTGFHSALAIESDYSVYVFCVPLIAVALLFAEVSEHQFFYRCLALLPNVVVNICVLVSGNLSVVVILALASMLLMGYALIQHSKSILVVGGVSVALSVGEIVLLSIDAINIHAWLGIAIVGVVLLILSSFFERFGRSLLNHGRASYSEVQSWSF